MFYQYGVEESRVDKSEFHLIASTKHSCNIINKKTKATSIC